MKEHSYLPKHSSFSPSSEFYKVLHFNPKIYKLVKIFSKHKFALSESNSPKKPRKNTFLSKKANPIVSQKIIEVESLKTSHLPKLPNIEEHKIVHAYEFRNLKLIKNDDENKIRTLVNKCRKEASFIKNSVQTFNFSPLMDVRTTSNKQALMPIEELKAKELAKELKIPEKLRRKIIFSKRKHSINAQDFSSFFDSQDTQRAFHSSFSQI